jgi:hypothetical protein
MKRYTTQNPNIGKVLRSILLRYQSRVDRNDAQILFYQNVLLQDTKSSSMPSNAQLLQELWLILNDRDGAVIMAVVLEAIVGDDLFTS